MLYVEQQYSIGIIALNDDDIDEYYIVSEQTYSLYKIEH